ncbi:lipid II:glycine glycyltransferase FemX [Pelagibacterium halotolerans]|uniref:lipid II:glycine glycyltransferase FemX n=1 Tax=Pelagibacterium halotolerans TaxID=531813 RepID=UPI00384F001E
MSLSANSLPMGRDTGRTERETAGRGALPMLTRAVLSPAEWDRAISDFDGVCQEQLYAYARMRWPGLSLEPVLFSDDKGPVGGALVMLQPLPLKLATIALVKWGPFLADNRRPDADAVMKAMVEALVADYADMRGMMLSIMPKVEPTDDNAGLAALLARGFSRGVGLKFPKRYVVDIRLDDDARLAAFAQKWRYHLRKSFKAGLSFEEGGADELDRFMALYKAMSDRKQFPDHSAIDSVDALMAMPEDTARPQIFFVTHEGETVAGAVIFTAGDMATYLYGATNDAALDLRAGYFLHWNIIRWLRDNTRARLYDLGGTDGFQGLHQFKSGMVGSAGYVADLPPIANYASSRRARLFGTLAYEGRSKLTRARDAINAWRLALMRRLRKALGPVSTNG